MNFINYFVIGRTGKYGNTRFGFRRGEFHIGGFAKDFLNEAEKAYGKFEFFKLKVFIDEQTKGISICGRFVHEDSCNAISLKSLFDDDGRLEKFLLAVWSIWGMVDNANRLAKNMEERFGLADEMNYNIHSVFAEIIH